MLLIQDVFSLVLMNIAKFTLELTSFPQGQDILTNGDTGLLNVVLPYVPSQLNQTMC